MSLIYIGIDDTDILGGPGTGKVARGLAAKLDKLGLGISQGVSRHQLLVDSRIKFTSHNSCKGLAIQTNCRVEGFYQPCLDYLQTCFQVGSDPGLCLCPEDLINQELLEFGRRAQMEVLSKAEAVNLAASAAIFLRELGGSGDGIIGALASIGLRAGGNDGRLVDLRGIKELKGIVSVKDILTRTDILRVEDPAGLPLPGEEWINSLDWIRPSLVRGQPVLRVKPGLPEQQKPCWVPVEQRHPKSGGQQQDE